MTVSWRGRRSPFAWGIGLLVLACLGFAIHALLSARTWRSRPRAEAPVAQRPVEGRAPAVEAPAVSANRANVGGLVLRPDGAPAAGVTVSIYRMQSVWPEWRRVRIDQAITGADGAFQFRMPQRHGLLVGFEHADFAGGLEEVPLADARLQLQLQPAFELRGFVTSPSSPVSNARVAIESVRSDQRRARSVTTATNGFYVFTNLPAGPVRLVVRHDSWEPVAVPVVVVGDQVRRDISFERSAGPPLRGRVTSQNSPQPIEGATIEVLPANSRAGLAEPIVARSAADGTFTIGGLSRGGLRLVVRHDGYGSVMRTTSSGASAADLLLELPLRSRVQGRLLAADAVDLVLGGEILQVLDATGEIDHAVVAADGTFRCDSTLSPGWASIRVLGREFAFERTTQCEAPVRIETSARTELELPIVKPGAVRGRVVDGAGRPLAGVAVSRTRLLAESARSIGSAVAGLDIGSLGSQVAQLFRDDRDERLAISGKDGVFEVRGQGQGPLLARFDLPGHGSRSMRLAVASAGAATEVGDVVMARGCQISGRVVRGGRGLAGATVTIAGDESQAVVTTREGGLFRASDLAPGEYRVRARLPSMPTGSRERVVRTDVDKPAGNVVLVVEAGRSVAGVVTGSDGQPVPGALVTVRGAVGQTTVTGSDGDFLIELPDRDAELQVSVADRSSQRVVPVPLGQDRVTVSLDTPRTCTLTAQIMSLVGRQRLPGVLVRSARADGSEPRAQWIDAPNGELRWEYCPVGSLRLQFCSEGHAPVPIDERDFAANDVVHLGELVFEPGARFAGIVRDETGAPVANASVWLGEEADIELFEPRVRSRPDGSFEIGGVTHRSSRVVVRATGFAPTTVDLVLPNDVLSATPMPVTIERGATIEVTLAGENTEGSLVQLLRQGRVVANAEADENNHAWFWNRSDGGYQVQIVGSSAPAKQVVVTPGATVVRVQVP